MKTLLQWLTVAMSLLMIVAGLAHFFRTRMYLRIVPEFFPWRIFIIQVSGLVECLAGVGLLIPATRRESAITVLVLMITFLPLHIWDPLRERPAMGTRAVAWVRLGLQFVLIAWAWYITRPVMQN